MERRIGTGLVAGLIAGIVFTLVALFLKTTGPDGGQTSMLIVAAEELHSHGWVAGWIASLIYTIVIGGIFGWLVSAEAPNEPRLMVWGGLYGLVWWILSGLFVVPALLGEGALVLRGARHDEARRAGVPDRARAVRRDSRIRLRAAHDVRRPASCAPCRPPCRLILDRNSAVRLRPTADPWSASPRRTYVAVARASGG